VILPFSIFHSFTSAAHVIYLSFNMYTSIFTCAALLSVAHAHGVILAAQGIAGSPASVGFKGMVLASLRTQLVSNPR
jgi:hypothetical protein